MPRKFTFIDSSTANLQEWQGVILQHCQGVEFTKITPRRERGSEHFQRYQFDTILTDEQAEALMPVWRGGRNSEGVFEDGWNMRVVFLAKEVR